MGYSPVVVGARRPGESAVATRRYAQSYERAVDRLRRGEDEVLLNLWEATSPFTGAIGCVPRVRPEGLRQARRSPRLMTSTAHSASDSERLV